MTLTPSGTSLAGACLALAVSLGACASPGSNVPPGTPSGDLLLEATGSGNWTVDCSATTTRGRDAASDITGRGGDSYDVIALRDVVSASCRYDAGGEPLTMTLEEAGIACPFGDFADGICRTTGAADDTGTLDFTPA